MTDEPPRCRSCGSNALKLILSLGSTPLANSLLKAGDLQKSEETYPLDLVLCPDCTLVQITETVSPEKLFSEYLYFSSFSDTMLKSAAELVGRTIQTRGLDGNSLAVEIASNDGYLLQYYGQAGVPVLGIEPAQNVARFAREKRSIPTLNEFFGIALAQKLRQDGKLADVIHANNVLAHVADLNGVVAGMAAILKPDGIAIIETPYVKELIDRVEFDTIYHEHLCYYSLTALARLFRRHGMNLLDVEWIPLHGGSLRVTAGRGAAPKPAIVEMLAKEARWGVGSYDFYRGFGKKVETLKKDLVELLSSLKAQGKRIAVYGASAKGSTLLNYFGIGSEMLDFVADRSTVKQGLFTPGTHLPVSAPDRLLEEMPDYALLLSWNFADEILNQQAEYRRRGGKFIIPIPQVCVV